MFFCYLLLLQFVESETTEGVIGKPSREEGRVLQHNPQGPREDGHHKGTLVCVATRAGST
jgi:hypothetical protein